MKHVGYRVRVEYSFFFLSVCHEAKLPIKHWTYKLQFASMLGVVKFSVLK